MFLKECLFDNVFVFTMISRIFCILPSNHINLLIQTDVTRIGNLTNVKVVEYVRIVLVYNLHLIATILDLRKNRSAWTFFLINDTSTHYDRSYLDNRIRIHIDEKLHNFHLFVISMYESHIDENMFHFIVCVLDIVCPHWKTQLIEIDSDGVSFMIDQFQSVVTRLINDYLINCFTFDDWMDN